MKANADDLAPNAQRGLWRDNAQFFAEGRRGAWRDAIPAPALAHYDRTIAELCPPDLVEWLHHGWLGPE
jgi:aryl sulfotransferase